MKVFSLEATDMGDNQSEIAAKVEEYVPGIDFKTIEEFYGQEGIFIERACKEMGWASCPQTGGLIVNWDSPTGYFE